MHDDSTVASFEDWTRLLGTIIRKFARESSSYDTRETPAEVRKRKDRETARLASGLESSGKSSGPRTRKFNLDTPKLHFLGDYPASIKKYGTTDGYSAMIVWCSLFIKHFTD